MNGVIPLLLKREFESRIFVSLGIVGAVCALCGFIFPQAESSLVLLGGIAGITPAETRLWGFVALAAFMMIVSILRMWAGSVLTAPRVMAFRVQADEFHTSGPYRIVRNPIYLADFAAMCAFALCLPPAGLLIPVLFRVHYARLIRYEEAALCSGFRRPFSEYEARTPRLLPSLRSLGQMGRALGEFRLTREGIRHNALYLLFVPGFLAAAWTGEFTVAVAIGLPAVADWAIVHTKLGIRR